MGIEMAFPAQAGGHVSRHNLVGVIRGNRVVTDHTSDSICFPGLRVRIKTGGVACETVWGFAPTSPFFLKHGITDGVSMRAFRPMGPDNLMALLAVICQLRLLVWVCFSSSRNHKSGQ